MHILKGNLSSAALKIERLIAAQLPVVNILSIFRAETSKQTIHQYEDCDPADKL